LVIYFGLHLRRELRTLKSTVEAQKATIEAQGAVLQDYERINKTMTLAVDTLSAPAILEQGEAYRTLVEKKTALLLEEQERQQARTNEFMSNLHHQTVSGFVGLVSEMLPFIPPDRRMALINAAALNRPYKGTLQELADAVPGSYASVVTYSGAGTVIAVRDTISGSIHPPDEEHPS
jgi:hypothetical protein